MIYQFVFSLVSLLSLKIPEFFGKYYILIMQNHLNSSQTVCYGACSESNNIGRLPPVD